MKQLVCKSCSGELVRSGNYYVCKHCGNKWIIDVSDDVNAVQRANAWEALRVGDFEKANDLFSEIILKDKTNHEAYWGRALAINAIFYVNDVYEDKKVPTCNNITEDSFISSKDVINAIKYAPEEIKETYEKQANEIEKIREEWLEKASKEPPYDVFISFKDSDREHGVERTKDSIDVQDLYTALVQKGYNVFFSRVTLRDKVSEQYEPYIYNALKTAKVMIVFGEKAEYFNAPWVKNEWSRFIRRIKNGEKHKNSLVVVYKDMDVSEIPPALNSGRQALDYGVPSNFEILINHVKRVIDATKKAPTVEKIEIKGGQIAKKSSEIKTETIKTREVGNGVVAETSIDTRQKLDLVYTYITKQMWDRAKSLIDDILFDNPQNAEGLFLELFTKYEIYFDYNHYDTLYDCFFVNLYKIKKEDLSKIEYIVSIASVSFAEKLLNSLYSIRVNITKENYIEVFRKLLPYNFNGRKEKIKELFEVAIKQSNFELFNILLSSLESKSVDEYIDYNLRFFDNTQDAISERICIDNVLSVQEGNVDALRGLIIISFKANENKKIISNFETLLKYSKDAKEEVKWFLNIFWSYGTDKKEQCALITQILRYYPGEISELYDELLDVSDTMLENKCFSECIELNNLMVGLNKLNAQACYWQICLCKLKVTCDEDIVKSDTPIGDLPEFTKYLALVNEEDRLEALDLSVEQENAIKERKRVKEEKKAQAELTRINKEKKEAEERRRQEVFEKEKKRHKRKVTIISVICALVVIFLAVFLGTGNGCGSCNSESGYVKMALSSDGTYYIVQEGHLSSKKEIVIPESYKGLPVKEIASGAFREDKMQTLVIPSTIEKIGDYAFYKCENLTDLYYNAKNVKDLTEDSNVFGFVGKEGEFTLHVGSTVKRIPSYLFYLETSSIEGIELTNIIFNEGCEEIGEYSFIWLDKLKEVHFPSTLKKIESHAFACTGLIDVKIPNNVESIGPSAFASSDLKKVDIGNGVKVIGDNAFNSCSDLEEITLGSNLTKVEKWAFHHSNSVKKVYYRGTKENYAKITIEGYNACLLKENIRSYI